MTERGAQCGMDKRKVCVFLVLVGIGLACLLLMAYMLFYATPHANPTLQKGPHSSLQPAASATVHS